MSAPVSGPEPRDGSQHTSQTRLVGAFATTMLLIASFAVSPAWGQDAGGAQPPEVPVAGSAPPPPPRPANPTPPPSVPAVPSPPAKPDIPPVNQHARPGVPTSGDTADQWSQRRPGRAGGGDRNSDVYSTDDPTNTTGPSTANRDRVNRRPQSAITRADHGPLRGHNSSPVPRPAKSRHANAKMSPLGFGRQLPGRNPSLSLQSPGGAAAGLALAGMLAVLGAGLVLVRDRSRIFRTPTATWRPSAYVPPIESPG